MYGGIKIRINVFLKSSIMVSVFQKNMSIVLHNVFIKLISQEPTEVLVVLVWDWR